MNLIKELSSQERKIFGFDFASSQIWTWDSWVESVNATSVLCCPTQQFWLGFKGLIAQIEQMQWQFYFNNSRLITKVAW